MTDAVTTRPITDTDQDFLFRLYTSTREEEMAVAPWSDGEKETFLRGQFELQNQQYSQNYADASFDIIMLHGDGIGRLYVQRQAAEMRIIDIALLPEHRGKGIGGRILHGLLQEAADGGLPVRLHVLKTNGAAIELYRRIGFEKVEEAGMYDQMEWRR